MTDRPPPCSSAEHRQLDFWLGDWELSWPAEQTGGEVGEVGTGANSITRLFDDCVIEENFATSDGSFLGHSVSVFNARTGRWHQTWVDSQGGHLVFTGGPAGDEFIFQTDPEEREGEEVTQRMVFSEVATGSLLWSWQGSKDGGETWTDLWTITYRRRD